MGADLVGYMLKGPRELDRDRFELALGIAANAIGQAEIARELTGEDFVRGDFDALESGTIDLDCDLECIAGLDPTSELSDLIRVWEVHNVRDLATRIDPDDEDQRIVFAGGMSWGDEPDGFAYRVLRNADMLGMLDVFGIK